MKDCIKFLRDDRYIARIPQYIYIYIVLKIVYWCLQVLQRSMDMELELIGVGGKGSTAAGQPVARLTITGLTSTPVDHDTKNNNTLINGNI